MLKRKNAGHDSENYVAKESKNEHREQVMTNNCMLRQRPETKTENFVGTELPRSQQRMQFGLEFWGSTM